MKETYFFTNVHITHISESFLHRYLYFSEKDCSLFSPNITTQDSHCVSERDLECPKGNQLSPRGRRLSLSCSLIIWQLEGRKDLPLWISSEKVSKMLVRGQCFFPPSILIVPFRESRLLLNFCRIRRIFAKFLGLYLTHFLSFD